MNKFIIIGIVDIKNIYLLLIPTKTMVCPFCSILKDDKKNQIIRRGKRVTAIRKLYKSDNTNFMIISNDHVKACRDIDVITQEGAELWCEFLSFATLLANGRDFNLKISNGKRGGQTVFHAHVHVGSFDPSWF